ncbi:MAG: hypothetical protein OEX74_12600 [Gammaproteobacteria bacterium]|nr:hypothetical protein [Gammaproteobacteria bacterium]
MNSGFAFVVAIVAIVMCARVAETWLKQRKQAIKSDGEAEEMDAKIEQLEERIRVLERIVTEKPRDLKREIDSL